MEVDDSKSSSEIDRDPIQNQDPNSSSSTALISDNKNGGAELNGGGGNDEQISSGTSTPTMAETQQQSSSSSVVGPRPVPSYTVVNALIDKKEDGPGSRCGHTLTAVSAVGEEGTPGYIGPRLILYGGATALEGNSVAAGIHMFSNPCPFSSDCFIWVLN